jgi:hypothetical protein
MIRKSLVMGLVGVVATGMASLSMAGSHSDDKPVGITGDLLSIEVMHNGSKVTVERNADNQNTVNPSFALTSRPCPPFCIQPMKLAPGVETIGEVEMIGYMEKASAGDDSILIIDSRTPDWAARGMIKVLTQSLLVRSSLTHSVLKSSTVFGSSVTLKL